MIVFINILFIYIVMNVFNAFINIFIMLFTNVFINIFITFNPFPPESPFPRNPKFPSLFMPFFVLE